MSQPILSLHTRRRREHFCGSP